MTTVDNPKVSPPSGKDEDSNVKGFLNRPRAGGKSIWDLLHKECVSTSKDPSQGS